MSLSPQPYNVQWDSPSDDIRGTMPLGNGDLAANVHVTPQGDLILLIAKSDSWDENATLLKLGRVRVRLTPGLFSTGHFTAGDFFQQTLRLPTGDIEIRAGDPQSPVILRLWADARRPVLHIDIDSPRPVEAEVALEIWRTHEYPIKTQTGDLFRKLGAKVDPFPTIVSPDQLLADRPDRIVWLHHNAPREHDGFEINMRLQGLGDFLPQMTHPLLGRTFGGAIEAPGFHPLDDKTLRSDGPQIRLRIQLHALTLHPATVESWQAALHAQIEATHSLPIDQARTEHEQWWADFWARSGIVITTPDPAEQQRVYNLTRAIFLQRYMNAAAGRGASPIKFNGSLFSVGVESDPDFRRWGGPGYWFMNQRLIYWPMLAFGDFDLLRPWLDMYLQQLPLHRHRTRVYYNHPGAHYPETILFWGAEVSAHYGWTPFEQRQSPEAECAYVRYYWTGGLELTLLLCECYAYTLDQAFAQKYLLPIAREVMAFFNAHYPDDEQGRLRIHPAQALETWHEAVNPLPDLAGLQYTLNRLLELPDSILGNADRADFQRLLGRLPHLPVGEKDGQRVLLPAERFDKKTNAENPELYAVFPFRIYGVGKPDLQLARQTYQARLHRGHTCWSQDDIQSALLGLVDEAKQNVLARADPACASESRFPAFWNAFHDWAPDMDHGGVLQLAVQYMLLQCEGKAVRLLPAWPNNWDCNFRLHTPAGKIITGQVRQGQLIDSTTEQPPARPISSFGVQR